MSGFLSAEGAALCAFPATQGFTCIDHTVCTDCLLEAKNAGSKCQPIRHHRLLNTPLTTQKWTSAYLLRQCDLRQIRAVDWLLVVIDCNSRLFERLNERLTDYKMSELDTYGARRSEWKHGDGVSKGRYQWKFIGRVDNSDR
jgi:hypothetical protein